MAHILRWVLWLCVLGSWGYFVAALVGAMRWRGTRIPENPNPPSVSVLVPVYGEDAEQYANFSALCTQNYPSHQVIFGALDADDKGLETARRVQSEFPHVDVTVVAGGAIVGTNRKVCNLLAMLPHAKHPVLCLCDSDMRVEPHYLSHVAAPLANLKVGMVTCLYRAKNAVGIPAKLEALGIGAEFLPSVLVANMSGIRFAFGATIAFRSEVLAKIGGFEAIVDNLADDYLLGALCHKAGYGLILSDYLLETVSRTESLGTSLSRRLRWAKTARAMQPRGWAGAFVTHGFALSLLFLVASGFDFLGFIAVSLTLLFRVTSVALIATNVTRDAVVSRSLWLLPISDLVSFALYLGSYLGNTVVWRGVQYRLKRGGALEKSV